MMGTEEGSDYGRDMDKDSTPFHIKLWNVESFETRFHRNLPHTEYNYIGHKWTKYPRNIG